MRTLSPATRRLEDEFERALGGARTVDADAADLAALAVTLRPPAVELDPAFRVRLRERLVAEAVVPQQRVAGAPAAVVPSRRGRVAWYYLAAGTAVTVFGVTALGAHAATGALPGDRLYDIKLGIEALDLSLAHGHVAVGDSYLDHAETRLGESLRIVTGTGSGALRAARLLPSTLANYRDDALNGAGQLLAAYDDRGDPELLSTLDGRIASQEERLVTFVPALPPDLLTQVDGTLADLVRVGGQVAQRAVGCEGCGLVRSAGAVLMSAPAALLPLATSAVAVVTSQVPPGVLGPPEIPSVTLPPGTLPPGALTTPTVPGGDGPGAAGSGPTPAPVSTGPSIGDVVDGSSPAPPGVTLPPGPTGVPSATPTPEPSALPTSPVPTDPSTLPSPTDTST